MSEDKRKVIHTADGAEIIDSENNKTINKETQFDKFENKEVIDAEFVEMENSDSLDAGSKKATRVWNINDEGVGEEVEITKPKNVDSEKSKTIDSKLPEVSPLEKMKAQMKEQMKEQLKGVSNDELRDRHVDTLEELSDIKKELRELKKEFVKLNNKVSESLDVNHYASETKVNFATQAFNTAKEKASSFFEGIGRGFKKLGEEFKGYKTRVSEQSKEYGRQVKEDLQKFGREVKEEAKDFAEDVKLDFKRDYHSEFQKTRAFLKSTNDLVLKPAANFTVKKYKESQKKLDVIHNKVDIELTKQGLDKNTKKDYTVMFVAVATKEAGKKLYKVTGIDKVVQAAKGVKNAYDKANNNYKANVEANKQKLANIEEKIEKKAEAKKQKAL